jgi:hypothetical protein
MTTTGIGAKSFISAFVITRQSEAKLRDLLSRAINGIAGAGESRSLVRRSGLGMTIPVICEE